MAASYVVKEEDGTSKLTLEEGGGSLLLEESVGQEHAGYAVAGLVGAGTSESVLAETGSGVVGAVGAGAKEFIGAVVYLKDGYATVGTVGSGVRASVTGGATYTKTGRGIVGTTATSRNAQTVQPRGVSLGLGQSPLTAFPDWTRIDGG